MAVSSRWYTLFDKGAGSRIMDKMQKGASYTLMGITLYLGVEMCRGFYALSERKKELVQQVGARCACAAARAACAARQAPRPGPRPGARAGLRAGRQAGRGPARALAAVAVAVARRPGGPARPARCPACARLAEQPATAARPPRPLQELAKQEAAARDA
jgi:hypothetical protein